MKETQLRHIIREEIHKILENSTGMVGHELHPGESLRNKDIYIDDIAGGVTISDPQQIEIYLRGETAYGTDRDGNDIEIQSK